MAWGLGCSEGIKWVLPCRLTVRES